MKIGTIIPIRLASERLPKKALMNIKGKPVVHHILERAMACKYIKNMKNVVVCTTEETSDDELVPVVEAKGASIFRGSTDDIVKRLCDAVEHFGFDAVIEIDGDDVTADPLYMDYCMDSLLEDDTEVVFPKDLPLGLATKALKRSAFESVRKIYKTEKNDTGFMYYFLKTGYCKVKEISPVNDKHKNDKARLTLDYQEDLDFFKAIFDELYEDGKVFNIDDICGLLDKKPELMEINSKLNEEYWARTKEKMKIEYEADDKTIKKIEF